MNILSKLPKPFFILAPMDDVTDTVFRRIVGSLAPPDLYFTEFMNVDGYCSPGKDKVAKKIKKTDNESPIFAQLWGKNPDNYYQTAKELAGLGFDGIDINMGCPVKAVVKNGCCSALINHREDAKAIIEATRKGIDASGESLPLSVKTRIGWNTIDLSWIEFLLEQNLEMLTVHLRTVKEQSKVPAHWDLMNDIKKLRDKIAPTTLLIGNGDVNSLAHAKELTNTYKIDGVMIGRGIFHDPYLFSKQSVWEDKDAEFRINLYKQHIELFEDTWAGKYKTTAPLNKFCKIYINGFDGAKELREKLMGCQTTDELLSIIEESLGNHSTKQ